MATPYTRPQPWMIHSALGPFRKQQPIRAARALAVLKRLGSLFRFDTRLGYRIFLDEFIEGVLDHHQAYPHKRPDVEEAINDLYRLGIVDLTADDDTDISIVLLDRSNPQDEL